MGDEIRPFKIHVREADLEDLKKRLRATRWPDPQTVPGWSQGVPLAYVQKICEYWARDYDWRKIEGIVLNVRSPPPLPRLFHTTSMLALSVCSDYNVCSGCTCSSASRCKLGTNNRLRSAFHSLSHAVAGNAILRDSSFGECAPVLG
jgi:hypothetical protein